MSIQSVAGWYGDPLRRFHMRYWDGFQWTAHVSSNGQQWHDPLPAASAPLDRDAQGAHLSPQPPSAHPGHQQVANATAAHVQPGPRASDAAYVQRQLRQVHLPAHSEGVESALFAEQTLVIRQRAKLIELRAEYSVFDSTGQVVAAVQGKRVSSRLRVTDQHGNLLFDLRKELSLLSTKVAVTDAAGRRLGLIVPSLNPNKVTREFKLEGPRGAALGEVHREDRSRSRRRSFRIEDASGTLIADVSKTRSSVTKAVLTNADDYVLAFSGDPSRSSRTLSIAVVIVIDSAFHQK